MLRGWGWGSQQSGSSRPTHSPKPPSASTHCFPLAQSIPGHFWEHALPLSPSSSGLVPKALPRPPAPPGYLQVGAVSTAPLSSPLGAPAAWPGAAGEV